MYSREEMNGKQIALLKLWLTRSTPAQSDKSWPKSESLRGPFVLNLNKTSSCAFAVAFWVFSGFFPSDARATSLDVYDGFETPELSKIWDTDRFEAGAVQIQTDVVRAGHSAARVVVHPHDKFEAGSVGTSDSERAELRESWKLIAKERTPYEYSFSMYFPTNFPIEPTRLVIAQWKQYCPEGGNCSEDSPVLALRYISGELKITQDIDKKHITLYQAKGEYRGRWLDFKVQTRFSPSEHGRIRVALGDKQLVDFSGVTANSEDAATGYPTPSYFFFKMGLYRNSVHEPWTSYIDEYRKRELTDGSFN